jgi:hypothetical protein
MPFAVSLQALDRLRELIDRHDDLYINQKALVDADCAFYLVELLQDDDVVALKASKVVSLICDHSAPAKAKLQNGPLIGLESSVAKVMLNPVQGEFIDAGAVPILTRWLTSPEPQKVEAALQALTHISSYNHDGKVAYLESLVDIVSSGEGYQCLEYLDDLIDSLHSGGGSTSSDDTVLQLYEKVAPSVIQAIRSPGQVGEKAVAVLGTLCEHAPELAKELKIAAAPGSGRGFNQDDSSVVILVAKHVLFGSLQAQDTAARALWYLTLGDKEILGSEGPLAAQAREGLAANLRALVERSAKDEEEEDEREDLRRNSVDLSNYKDDDTRGGGFHSRGSSYGGGGGGIEGFGPGLAAAAVEEVCFAEEAQQLLKALIACNPELKIESNERTEKGTSCCVM